MTEQASDYLEGDLPWGRRLVFRFHLAMCGACSTFVKQIDLVRRALPLTRDDVALSDGTRASVLSAFDHHHDP